MTITPLGAKTIMQGLPEKKHVASSLLSGSNISSYTNGMCLDTVAYVRHLLGANINDGELMHYQREDWIRKFDFLNGSKWNGRTNIPRGTAVGFYRLVDRSIFHASISTGGTYVRSVNGMKLGSGWELLNLRTALGEINEDGTFNFDRTKIEVYLSNL